MIDKSKIYTATNELVGYKEEQEVTLSASQKISNSDLFVNDIPGVDLISIQKSQWIKTDLNPDKTVTEYLDDIYNPVVLRTVNNFVRRMQDLYLNRDLMKDNFFVKAPPYQLTTQNERFIGYALRLKDSNSLRFVLKAIALQANKAQTVKLFLYDLNSEAPVWTYDYTIDNARARKYDDDSAVQQILNFADESSAGNTYLLGYFESISDNVQTWMLDSDSDAYESHYDYKQFLEVGYIAPISIDVDNFTWTGSTYNLSDEILADDISGDSYYSPLSVKFAIDCEYTFLIVNNIDLFAETLQYELAKQILGDAIASKTFNQLTESNRKEWQETYKAIRAKLEGYYVPTSEGKDKVKGLYDSLIDNFEDIDCECFRTKLNRFM